MSSAGPTQGENRVSGKWTNRPFLAGALRFTVMAAPTIASFMATRLFTKSFPADSVDVSIIRWWLIVITVGITVLVGADSDDQPTPSGRS